jgi:hypothetical protein
LAGLLLRPGRTGPDGSTMYITRFRGDVRVPSNEWIAVPEGKRGIAIVAGRLTEMFSTSLRHELLRRAYEVG